MKKKQWHPVFAQLLRPVVESHYEVRTNVPVGDVPREADLLLLRRISSTPLPFTGLWRNLAMWNVLEFKGPTVSARVADLDLLIELGLGIHRRLSEAPPERSESPAEPGHVSFWYLANHLGRRFLRDCDEMLGPLEAHGAGVWRCHVLRRVLFLVSGTDLPIESDALPLHVIGRAPPETERALVEYVARRPALVERYGGFLATLHPSVRKEVEAMAKAKRGGFDFDFEPLIQLVGAKRVIEAVGDKRAIETIGVERVIDAVGLDRVVEEVGLGRVIEEVGVDRVVKEVGLDRVIAAVGIRHVIDKKGVEWLLEQMSPAQRREMKERLKA